MKQFTGESVGIQIAQNGQIYWYTATPYMFEDVKLKPIDESILLKKLEELVNSSTNNVIDYKIKTQGIGVDFDNDMIMIYNVNVEYELVTNKSSSESSPSEQETHVMKKLLEFDIKI